MAAAVVISVLWWIFDLFFIFFRLRFDEAQCSRCGHCIWYHIRYQNSIRTINWIFHEDCIASQRKTLLWRFLGGSLILNENCLAHEHEHTRLLNINKNIFSFDAHYIDSHHSINFIWFFLQLEWPYFISALIQNTKWNFVEHISKWRNTVDAYLLHIEFDYIVNVIHSKYVHKILRLMRLHMRFDHFDD